MDETGHSGDTGPATTGADGEPGDRPVVNGWTIPGNTWSSADAAVEPDEEGRSFWRRAPGDVPPFPRQPPPPEPPSGEMRPFVASAEVRPVGTARVPEVYADSYGSAPAPRFGTDDTPPFPGIGGADAGAGGSDPLLAFGTGGLGDVRLPVASGTEPSGSGWSSGRYADLLPPVSPDPGPAATLGDELGADLFPPSRPVVRDAPSSAPPYPYEGDLDDARRSVVSHRASVPLSSLLPAVPPTTSAGRRMDWIDAGSARHGIDQGETSSTVAPAEDQPPTGEISGARAGYEPAGFPRLLPYEPVSPASSDSSPEPPGHPGGVSDRDGAAEPAEPVSGALPQRVPAEPDVPTVPEPPSAEPPAETPALARIATHLRRGDVLPAEERPEGFDVQAILAAVQEVKGVREASLRTTPQGAHSLRLDLAEGADPAEVSRQVARLLQDRMGLDAAMQGAPSPTASASVPVPGSMAVPPSRMAAVSGPPAGTVPAPAFVPAQPVPTGRATVGGMAVAPPEPLPTHGTETASASAPAKASIPTPAAALPAAPVWAPADPEYVAGPATTDGRAPTAEWGPPRPLAVRERPGPRVVIDNVQVSTFGTEATVEVRLGVGDQVAAGTASGPAVDGYLLRLCATATAQAVDELLATTDHVDGPARCFVEHAAAVPFGPAQVAVVVLLLSCGGWVEQLAGSAVITGDDRHATVRATLAAVNRRLEALLS